MIRWVLTALVAAVLAMPAATAAGAQPGQGVINGEIVNRTVGGISVADEEVTLVTLRDGAVLDTTATTRSDAAGRFQFTGLSTEADYRYRLTVRYQGAVYYADDAVFAGGAAAMSARIVVYDSTRSSDAVRIAMSHLLIYPEGDSLAINEYYVVANGGDRTYVGPPEGTDGKPGVLRFSLPAAFRNLELALGLQYQSNLGNLIIDPMPLAPGMREEVFSYRVPLRDGVYDLEKTLYYATDAYRVLVLASGVEVTSSSLAVQDPIEIQGKRFSYLLGRDIPAGGGISVRLAGSRQGDPMGAVRWAGIMALAVAVVAGLIYAIRRRQKRLPVLAGPSEGLVEEIARLDDEYEAGRISEEQYQQQRADTKVRLRRLLEEARKRPDDA